MVGAAKGLVSSSRRWLWIMGFHATGAILANTNTTITMKETLLSLVRHALIALLSLGTFLSSRGMIAPEDVEAVNASGATIREALAVAITAMLARLILKFGGKIYSAHKGDGNPPGSLLLLLGLAGLATLGLPSCTPAQREAAAAVPVKACYTDAHGNTACYSSKGGIEVDVRSGK